jgi:hypothetical protein
MLILLKIASMYDNGTAFQVGAIICYFMTLPLIWMIREPSDAAIFEEVDDTVKQNANKPIESASLFSKIRKSVPVLPSKTPQANGPIPESGKNSMQAKKRSMGSLQFEPNNKHSLSFRDSHQFSDISHETVEQERSENIGFVQFRSWSKVEQFRYLIKKVWSLTTTNLRYSISLWGYAISNIAADLVNVYFVLWLSRFVISGELTSQD